MSETAAVKTPTPGDPVLFEGLPHRVAAVVEGKYVQFASEATHARQGKHGPVDVPRFTTTAAITDLRWSEEIGAWYLWGRLLGRARGGAGVDQHQLVVALRDLGLVPARSTRRTGSGPAGGEELNLYRCLFHGGGVDWRAEVVRRTLGEPLGAEAQRRVDFYRSEFAEPLPDGYAAPGANDSSGG